MRVARAPTGVESHKDRGDILRESSIPCLGLKRFLFHPNLPSAELLLDQWCTRKVCCRDQWFSRKLCFFLVLCMTCLLQTHSLNLEGRCWDRLSRDWGAKAMHLAGSVRTPHQGRGLTPSILWQMEIGWTCFSTNSPVSSFSFSIFFRLQLP